MRAVRNLVVGMGALLAGCTALGCSSSSTEGADDAGSLDGFSTPDDAPSHDTSVPPLGSDAGDATLGEGPDASGASSEDAGDGSVAHEDGGGVDARPPADASDAGEPVDASDATSPGADGSDAASSGVDASDAGVDDAGEDSSVAAEDSSTQGGADAASDDAGVDALDAPDDAEDAAVACVSCGTSVSYLSGASGFVSAGGAPVTLSGGGTVPDGDTVSVVVQTYPKGSATVHVVYATSADFSGQTDVVMTYDTNQPTPNNDQWFTVLPAQAASTTVYFYVRADGCDCATVLYEPGGFANYTYTEL